MESISSIEFFLEEKRCNLFEFGAYLGSCMDEEGQRKKALALFEHFGIVPKKAGSIPCDKCGHNMTPKTDIHANMLGWRWKCKVKQDDGTEGCGKTVMSISVNYYAIRQFMKAKIMAVHLGLSIEGHFAGQIQPWSCQGSEAVVVLVLQARGHCSSRRGRGVKPHSHRLVFLFPGNLQSLRGP